MTDELAVLAWRPAREWKLGTPCLICCVGAEPREPGYVGSVSEHYGMASLPPGTRAWMEMPAPPPLDFDGGYVTPTPEMRTLTDFTARAQRRVEMIDNGFLIEDFARNGWKRPWAKMEASMGADQLPLAIPMLPAGIFWERAGPRSHRVTIRRHPEPDPSYTAALLAPNIFTGCTFVTAAAPTEPMKGPLP